MTPDTTPEPAPAPSLLDRLMLWPARAPRRALLVVLAASCCLALFLPRLRVDSTMDTIFLRDAEREAYEAFKDTFGEDELVVIGLLAPPGEDVFNQGTLAKVERVTRSVEDLPPEDGVERVVSLTNVEDIRGVDGMLDVGALLPPGRRVADLTAEGLERIRRQAFDNPLFLRNVVAADGRATAITVTLQHRPGDQSFKEPLVRKLRAIAAAEQGPEELYVAGIPVLTQYTRDFLLHDLAVLVPVTATIIVLVLWLAFRSAAGVLLPLGTVGVSVLWMLGFAGLAGKPISLLSAIAPSLLMAIGSAYAIHVVVEYSHQTGEDPAAPPPLEQALRRCFAPVVLSGLTTAAGFLALMTNDVLLIREFGLVAAFGVCATTLLTLLGVPAVLAIVRPAGGGPRPLPSPLSLRLRRLLSRLAEWDIRHPRTILAAGPVCAGLGGWGAARIHVDTDYAANFHPGSEPVRALRFLRDHLAGERPINIVLTPPPGTSALDPQVIARVEEVQRLLQEHRLVTSTLSVADYLKRIHQALHDGDPAYFQAPGSLEAASQYLLILSRPDDIERLLARDEGSAVVIGRSSIISSEEFLDLMEHVRAETRRRWGDELGVTITGSMYLLSRASIKISIGQAKSLGLACLLVFLVMFALFRSLKHGLVALLPNVLPILANFALMGVLGVTLNTGTSVMAAMALGIAVDDTIHVLTRYRALRATHSAAEAVRATLDSVGLAVTTTSATNALGFLVLTLSSFAPLVALGWLTAVTMTTALIADLVLLPALLLVFDAGPPTGARGSA